MRPIDADALIKRLDYCVSQGLGSKIAFMFGHMIDEAPTVDAVPVIRCKDCRYYRGDHEYCVNDMFAIENGFCNWAERKEECGHQ